MARYIERERREWRARERERAGAGVAERRASLIPAVQPHGKGRAAELNQTINSLSAILADTQAKLNARELQADDKEAQWNLLLASFQRFNGTAGEFFDAVNRLIRESGRQCNGGAELYGMCFRPTMSPVNRALSILSRRSPVTPTRNRAWCPRKSAI